MSSIEYSIWPESLIEELAARRCVLFLGSGISATASTEDGIKPKTWGQFIEGIKSIARNASEDDMKYINEQIKKEDYLLALQAIYDACIPADYVRYLKSEFMVDFKPSKVHEFIRKIDSKVVITTNFDSIYDNLCKGSTYSILDYEEAESIVQTLKSPTNLIIKAHGTIQKPTKLIFTSSQYFKSQQENPVFYNILYSLFLTNIVVFLGYGLSDPDINLILQYLHKSACEASPHYLVKEKGTAPQLIKHWKETYNVQIIEYGDSYADLEPAIEELANKVDAFRADRAGVGL